MDQAEVAWVVVAVAELTIVPRADMSRWAHLSLCVLDAVYSIGARYAGVVRVCHAYAEHARLNPRTVAHRDIATVAGTPSEQPLDVFVADVHAVGVDRFAGEIVGHRGRTSARGGILKADAALRYAQTLFEHGVRRLSELHGVFADVDRFDELQAQLRRVPGNGAFDVRLGYLWVLIGDDDLVKPDRMVLRWLTRHTATPVDPATARELLPAVARVVGCTPWELDHAIWWAESGRSPRRR